MANPPTIPLHLCQVLEEEYVNLHQQLDPKPDWNFELKQFKGAGPGGLKAKLQAALLPPPDEAQPSGRARRPTDAYERARFIAVYAHKVMLQQQGAQDAPTPDDAALGQFVAGLDPALPLDDQSLIYCLNELLKSQTFYHPTRFPLEMLGDELEELVALGLDDALGVSERVKYGDDDCRRFNRLLLERAYGDDLEPIYRVRLNRIVALLHTREGSALSLSGGGIRSATFSLGVIQGLVRHGLLEQFTYLSTVSGGGYIGSWLSTWINRHRNGLRGVVADLVNQRPEEKLEPDPPPLGYLRSYSNFLTPKFSLLSADVWSFVAIYLRNLSLNWLVLVPLLTAALGVPRLGLATVQEHPNTFIRWLFFGGALILIGYAAAYLSTNRPSAADALKANRVWAARTDQPSFLKHCLLPLLVAGMALGAFWAWFRTSVHPDYPLEQQLAATPWSHLFHWLLGLLPWGLGQQRGLSWLAGLDEVSFFPFVLFACAAHLLGWVLHVGRLLGLSLHDALRGRLGPAWRELFSSTGWVRLREMIRAKELGTVIATGVAGGLLLWVVAAKIFPNPVQPPLDCGAPGEFHSNLMTAVYTCFSVPLFLLTFFFTVTVFVGLTSRGGRSRRKAQRAQRAGGWLGRFAIEDEDREWLARFCGWLLIVMAVWSIFPAVVMFGPLGLLKLPYLMSSLGGISGLVAVLAGKSARTPATAGEEARSGLWAVAARQGLTLVAVVFLLFFASLLSLLLSLGFRWLAGQGTVAWLAARLSPYTTIRQEMDYFSSSHALDYLQQPIIGHPHGDWHLLMNLYYPPYWLVLLTLAVLAVIGGLAARAVNLNLFSLHAGYRNRLIRTFLGASHEQRQPNPFTGFDPRDDTPMRELRPGLLRENSFQLRDGREVGLIQFLEWLQAEIRRLGLDAELQPQPATHLVQLFSADTREQILSYRAGQPPSPSLKADLISDLNRILDEEQVFKYQPFSESEPVQTLRELMNQFLAAELYRPPDEDNRDAPTPERNERTAGILQWLKGALPAGQHLSNQQVIDQLVEGMANKSLRGDYRLLINRLLLNGQFADFLSPLRYPPPPYGPMHVVNTALNLVSGDKLAWQQRKAESFAITPLHSGSLFVGYRRTREYGGAYGVTLGTAATISGAAANSNMGYLSTSPVVTFLLTLFNARLGWWFGNPGAAGGRYSISAGERFFRLGYPNSAIYPIFAEAFGLTNDRNSYVLLSDGGHFENLALYEMVLRRCRTIVVVDGGQDGEGKFEDLGNAVRKIRIDLGIPITFDNLPIYPRGKWDELQKEGKVGGYWAVGKIDYARVDGPECTVNESGRERVVKVEPGRLIYIKPAVYGGEPRDIYNYAQSNPAFPHEPTADQWFDEPQFESYRMLGSHIMGKLCGDDGQLLSLDQLWQRAGRPLTPPSGNGRRLESLLRAGARMHRQSQARS